MHFETRLGSDGNPGLVVRPTYLQQFYVMNVNSPNLRGCVRFQKLGTFRQGVKVRGRAGPLNAVVQADTGVNIISCTLPL